MISVVLHNLTSTLLQMASDLLIVWKPIFSHLNYFFVHLIFINFTFYNCINRKWRICVYIYIYTCILLDMWSIKKWHACLNSCTRYVFNLGVKPIQTINVFQYARLGQESPTEHNDKASNAYDFLYGKSKSSVEAVEQ